MVYLDIFLLKIKVFLADTGYLEITILSRESQRMVIGPVSVWLMSVSMNHPDDPGLVMSFPFSMVNNISASIKGDSL